MKAKADYLFEASWEVCNKVGGIYTVVKSKAYLMKDYYKNYFLIGPYFVDKAVVELTKKDPPPELAKAFDKVRGEGINCYYGEWNIDGLPNTILIDFNALISKKNEIKSGLWEQYKIDTMNAQWDFEEPMLWSWAIGMLLFAIEKNLPGKSIVGHFHEWLAGIAILYLKNYKSNVRTVFTTHATMLGRTIAGKGEDLYNILDHIDPKERAYKYGVQEKYLTEKASAENVDIFTTVSGITAIEAEKILGIKPDVILNNGLTLRKFPTIEETSLKHLTSRDLIREFLTFYFFPYYHFELEHNLTYFIIGRFEYENKGCDVFIKALGKLNERLKQENSKRTISAFIWMPMGTNGIKVDLLENKNYYKHIKSYVNSHSKNILDKIVLDIVSSKTPTVKSMFSEEFLKDLKKDLIVFKRPGTPPLATHNMIDEDKNPAIKGLMEAGLFNREEDKVKVIVYPVYLTGNDGLLDLGYYESMAGSHLGIFPSYYEPWGYTPVESAAMGVASVTTDLAGFGRFIETKIPNKEDKTRGIYVLKRYNRTKEEVVEDLFKIMHDYSKLTHEERVKNKLVAKHLVEHTDWRKFVQNYINAHNDALKKRV